MTRLLEGLTFTETDQGAENQLSVDAVELLEQKEEEIKELKKRIAELEAKSSGAGHTEVCHFLFSFSFSDLI